jgi:hypothetical protein
MKRADRRTRLGTSLAILVGALPIYLLVSLGIGIRLGWSPYVIALIACMIVLIAVLVFLFLPPPKYGSEGPVLFP